jgi:hypothetical protein
MFESTNIHHHASDASLDFGLQPGVGVFVQQQFVQFGLCLSRMEAMLANT